jgi:hypothetical protein
VTPCSPHVFHPPRWGHEEDQDQAGVSHLMSQYGLYELVVLELQQRNFFMRRIATMIS